MFCQVDPWFRLSCHCTVGAGLPPEAAVNVTAVFAHAVALTGCWVINGGTAGGVIVTVAV